MWFGSTLPHLLSLSPSPSHLQAFHCPLSLSPWRVSSLHFMSHMFHCRTHPFHPLSRHSCKRCFGALSCDINPSISILVCAPQLPTHTPESHLERLTLSQADSHICNYLCLFPGQEGTIVSYHAKEKGRFKVAHASSCKHRWYWNYKNQGETGKYHLPWEMSCAIREGLWPSRKSPKSQSHCVVLEDFLFLVCSSQIVCS